MAKKWLFISIYNWDLIYYILEKDDWKKFEKNKLTTVLYVLN